MVVLECSHVFLLLSDDAEQLGEGRREEGRDRGEGGGEREGEGRERGRRGEGRREEGT